MTEDQKILSAAIRADCGVWWELHGKILDKARELITPRQNYLQKKAQAVVNRFEELGLPVRIIQLKPRQKGSTTYAAALDYHHMRRKSASCCVIGGQASQTDSLWTMMETYLKHDGFDWGNHGEITATLGSWDNGSQLISETAGDKLAGISNTFQILHATEVARWAKYGVANAAGVLTNILKCVPLLEGTMVILESTAEGASGPFYERWIRAIDAEKFLSGEVVPKAGEFVRVFANWFEFDDGAQRLTDREKADIKRTLDGDPEYGGEKALIERYATEDEDGVRHLGSTVKDYDVWEQLAWRRWAIREECERDKNIFDRDYPHSWQTAFQKSGNQRFLQAGLAKLRERMGERVPMYGNISEVQGRMVFNPADKADAKFLLFEKPAVGRRYILSIDPMTGSMQANGQDPDYHGVNVLRDGYYDTRGNWNRIGVVARIPACRWDIDVLEEAVWDLARLFGVGGGCKIVVEMNQDRGLTELLKQRGADMYMREVFNRVEQKNTRAYGWVTMEKTREIAVERLASLIREYNSLNSGIDIWDEHTIEQCENFVRKPNGRSEAAEGFHDDEIFSIGIGATLIDHATTYMPQRFNEGLPPDLANLYRPTGVQISQFS